MTNEHVLSCKSPSMLSGYLVNHALTRFIDSIFSFLHPFAGAKVWHHQIQANSVVEELWIGAHKYLVKALPVAKDLTSFSTFLPSSAVTLR